MGYHYLLAFIILDLVGVFMTQIKDVNVIEQA